MRGIQRAGVRLLAGSLLGAGALAALATTAPPPAGGRPAAVVQVASRRPLEVARGAAADGSGQRLSEQSLLDEVGRLNGPVPGREIAGWRAALHAGRVAAPRSAWLHLWLGECALARDAQPEAALAQFREAERLAGPRDAARGAAAYDRAIALYELRAYQEATDAFHRLLVSRDGPRGFDRRRCAL